jgi:hypothetical protein
VTGRGAEVVGLALVAVLVLAGAWWYRNESTFGDPPREIHYEGCTYRPTGSPTTMHQAELTEHTPIVYRTTHFGQLGSTWAGRAFYGLEIKQGCPLGIYLQRPTSWQLELYMRGGGP